MTDLEKMTVVALRYAYRAYPAREPHPQLTEQLLDSVLEEAGVRLSPTQRKEVLAEAAL